MIFNRCNHSELSDVIDKQTYIWLDSHNNVIYKDKKQSRVKSSSLGTHNITGKMQTIDKNSMVYVAGLI